MTPEIFLVVVNNGQETNLAAEWYFLSKEHAERHLREMERGVAQAVRREKDWKAVLSAWEALNPRPFRVSDPLHNAWINAYKTAFMEFSESYIAPGLTDDEVEKLMEGSEVRFEILGPLRALEEI